MKSGYEIVCVGFDGSSDETDDLLIWVWAESEEKVHKYAEDNDIEVLEINQLDYSENENVWDVYIP